MSRAATSMGRWKQRAYQQYKRDGFTVPEGSSSMYPLGTFPPSIPTRDELPVHPDWFPTSLRQGLPGQQQALLDRGQIEDAFQLELLCMLRSPK